jgi:hypothetical protein
VVIVAKKLNSHFIVVSVIVTSVKNIDFLKLIAAVKNRSELHWEVIRPKRLWL